MAQTHSKIDRGINRLTANLPSRSFDFAENSLSDRIKNPAPLTPKTLNTLNVQTTLHNCRIAWSEFTASVYLYISQVWCRIASFGNIGHKIESREGIMLEKVLGQAVSTFGQRVGARTPYP